MYYILLGEVFLIVLLGISYILLQIIYPEEVVASKENAITLGVSIIVSTSLGAFNNYYNLTGIDILYTIIFIFFWSFLIIRTLQKTPKKITIRGITSEYIDEGFVKNNYPKLQFFQILLLNILPAITIYIVFEFYMSKTLTLIPNLEITKIVFLTIYFAIIFFLLMIILKLKSVIISIKKDYIYYI